MVLLLSETLHGTDNMNQLSSICQVSYQKWGHCKSILIFCSVHLLYGRFFLLTKDGHYVFTRTFIKW